MSDHPVNGVGYLEQRHYNRFVWAWSKAPAMVRWLQSADARGVNTAGEGDVRVDSSSAPTINLSPAWLQGDQIDRLITELEEKFTDPLTEAPNTLLGADLARNIGKAVSDADHAYPQEEKPHYVHHMRCGGCEQLTLAFRPPRWAGDKISVDCWCGYTLTEAEFALAAEIIKNDVLEAA